MPLPEREEKRELFRRPMSTPKLGPAQEHENLWATRCDTGFKNGVKDISCPMMFESMVRTFREDPELEPCFKPGASAYMEKTNK